MCVCKGRVQGILPYQLTNFRILERVHLHNLMSQFLINPLLLLIGCPLENPASFEVSHTFYPNAALL